MAKRKRRDGEVVCLCGSYPFPHRQMGGACNGAAFIEVFFESNMHSDCRDCHFRVADEDQIQCQVLCGLDSVMQCPGLADHIRYHSIRLYGVNRE